MAKSTFILDLHPDVHPALVMYTQVACPSDPYGSGAGGLTVDSDLRCAGPAPTSLTEQVLLFRPVQHIFDDDATVGILTATFTERELC